MFAGSAQFIGVGLVAAGAPVLVIALTTFVVNARHFLYAATLAPYLRGAPLRWLVPLGFWLTDESFVVAAGALPQRKTLEQRKWYLLGSEVAMYSNWQAATWVGILAGQAGAFFARRAGWWRWQNRIVAGLLAVLAARIALGGQRA